jgi:hypothetical protein
MGYKAEGSDRRIGKVRTRAAVLSLTLAGVTVAAGLTGAEAARAATAASAAAVSGTEYFQAMGTSPTATSLPLIEWGAVGTAGGIDHPNRSKNIAEFVFAGGTYELIHNTPVGPAVLNSNTCLLQSSQHGTYRVADGTGKYKGITGSGKFTVSIVEILAKSKSGACNPNANPVTFQLVVDGSGTYRIA